MASRQFFLAGRGVVLATMCLFTLPAAALEVPSALSAGDIVFYTLALTSVAFFSAGMILTRQFHWLTYSIYGMSMIALNASLDGTFAYLFSGYRWFMSDAPLIIGAATAAFGFVHVAYRLEPGHWLFSTRTLQLGFAAIMSALILLYAAVPMFIPNLVPLYATLNTGMLVMFIAQVFPPITWTQFSLAQHRATIIWPMTTALVGVGGYALHFFGSGFESATLNLFNRFLFGMHLMHLLVFVSISVIEQLRARVNAEQLAAETARTAAETALALEVSERDFERARSLASSRSRQLASASHDLKQPIAALRQVVEVQANDLSEKEKQRLRDAIDYLDQLASTYLTIGNRDIDVSLGAIDEIEHDELGLERVRVNVILDTVAALYDQQAKVRGIQVISRPTDTYVQVHPLALTRAVSNLMSNAIAHSHGTRVLLCSRPRGENIRIDVHDNGKGMSELELASAKEIRTSGEASSGSGLGLAIIQHQAEEQGWSFVIDSRLGHGTSAFLFVPRAQAIDIAGSDE